MADLVEVSARRMWVETPVWVQPGDRLEFRAEGTWVDAYIPCSADGYPAAILYALHLPPRIADNGRYLRLMGRIAPGGVAPTKDLPTATFPIGTRCQFRAEQAGRLFVFANDRVGFYWNNWGSLKLTVSR